MGKVIVIGIDALDSQLFERFREDLPHLNRLRRKTAGLKFTSVYPPDTPTAWASIYTGLNPARHGIVLFLDPLEKVSLTGYGDLDNTPVKGRTFWDIASRAGKRVCVLLPELGYPVWPVNGKMIARTSQRYGNFVPVQPYPPSLAERYDLDKVKRVQTSPRKTYLPQYVAAYRELLENETELAFKLYDEEDWDLFFFYSSVLDWAGHYLWSYFDPADPLYEAGNPYEHVIGEFYRKYDGIVGEFVKRAGKEKTVIVLSDHGQTMRPVKLLNINELLRQKGLLVPRIKSSNISDPFYFMEWLKGIGAKLVNRFGAGEVVSRLLYHLPSLRNIYSSPPSIDWKKTAAYVSDLSGIKAYSYGGIFVNRDRLGGRDYEQTRDELIREIGALQDPRTARPIARWICRREDMYSGDHLDLYPDILLRLDDTWGAGWALYQPLFSGSQTHNIVPGSHRMETPVFAMSASGMKFTKKNVTLMDIAPTVLKILDVKGDRDFDGSSIFEFRETARIKERI